MVDTDQLLTSQCVHTVASQCQGQYGISMIIIVENANYFVAMMARVNKICVKVEAALDNSGRMSRK